MLMFVVVKLACINQTHDRLLALHGTGESNCTLELVGPSLNLFLAKQPHYGYSGLDKLSQEQNV